MEYYRYCMEAKALKSSLRGELFPAAVMKSSSATHQQSIFDDILINNNSNNNAEDNFSVDCFFDFSNINGGEQFKDNSTTYIQEQQQQPEEEEEEEEEEEDNNSNSSSCVSDSFLTSELALPIEDLAELEWVSQFVDDSSSEFSLLYPENIHARNLGFQPEQPKPASLTRPSSCLFPVKIPAKPRSKRTRPTGRTWSVESLLTDSSSSSSSNSSSSTISSSSASTPCFVTVQTIDSLTSFIERPLKKPKKKPAGQTGGGLIQFQRRCSHCQVQKTPQWRTGPLGAKTLCNACGVRYKSGRLFPEYRPACSPTFSGDVHSNSHRKVLEIRKRKEVTGPESGLTQMVPSF